MERQVRTGLDRSSRVNKIVPVCSSPVNQTVLVSRNNRARRTGRDRPSRGRDQLRCRRDQARRCPVNPAARRCRARSRQTVRSQVFSSKAVSNPAFNSQTFSGRACSHQACGNPALVRRPRRSPPRRNRACRNKPSRIRPALHLPCPACSGPDCKTGRRCRRVDCRLRPGAASRRRKSVADDVAWRRTQAARRSQSLTRCAKLLRGPGTSSPTATISRGSNPTPAEPSASATLPAACRAIGPTFSRNARS